MVQNVGLGKQRAGFTHVALICENVSLQPRLHQVLLGNESLFPASTMAALQAGLPPNLRIWRRKSGWVTKPLMREILKELCAALGELLATHQVVLLLDTAGVHICPMFLRAASRKGIMVQCIPAKLTWLLQPLDTHVFARYKQYLMQEYRVGLMQDGNRATELTARVHAVAKACRKVLQAHAWAYAFDANGFPAQPHREVRQTILEEMQWDRVPELPAGLPTFAEFVAIFPARTHMPLAWLLRPYRDDTAEPPAAPSPEQAEPAAEDARPHPWFGRLRSSSTLALPQLRRKTHLPYLHRARRHQPSHRLLRCSSPPARYDHACSQWAGRCSGRHCPPRRELAATPRSSSAARVAEPQAGRQLPSRHPHSHWS